MRYVVFGAGAIGGLAGARMAEAGSDVVLIARGRHAEVMSRHGLTIESADRTMTVAVPVVNDPAGAHLEPGDVVLLAVKSQDTAAALDELRRSAPGGVAVACLQNGVENERLALRLFPAVYGVCVMCPATHLEPGVVLQNSSPVPGLLDAGRYPGGTDDFSGALVGAFRAAGFDSLERADIMRWKYRKLLMNLANAPQALISGPGAGTVARRARAEGEACLQAAGIDVATEEEDRDRRGDLLQLRPVGGDDPRHGSTWQSLQRRTGSIETDYLNGEVALLGRLYGVPTPVNGLLQALAAEAAARMEGPGGMTVEEFEARLAERR